jgi:NADH-quinone oxidoreductase subunit G
VGALTTRDFRFKIRVWFLEDVPGVCTGCAAGCNVHLGTANNKVYRYVPRRNDEVNETWICDGGRMSYKAIGSADRLTEVQIRDESGRLAPVTRDRALAETARRLQAALDARGPGGIAALASPHATNEDLFALRRLLDAMGIDLRAAAIPLGASDELLIQSEKAANGAGARALGFAAPDALLERVRNGGVEALLVLGHDILDERYLADEAGLGAIDTVILFDTHHSALERVAHVVFPARHAAEKLGTLTNHAGRVQRVEPAVEPGHEAHAEGEILTRLGAALGLPGFEAGWDPRAVSAAIAAEVPAFAGADLGSLGPEGQLLSGSGTETG